jgi:glycosyltransferase involved in cell wall biosynthesis
VRVIHIINSLGGSGGAENGLVREITRFDPGVDQLVIRLFGRADLDPILTEHGIQVEGLGLDGSRATWNWPVAATQTRAWIRRFEADVVHTSLFTANIVGQLAGRSTNTPIVSTFTQSGDVSLIRSHQPSASTISAGVQRSIARWSARSPLVTFRSLTHDAMATNLKLLGVPSDRATVIPRGVEATAPSPSQSIRSELGIGPGTLMVCNIGRQAAQKGHRHLIAAFEQLARTLQDVHLVVIGREGDATASTRAQVAASPVQDRIHFLGYRPDARAILSASNVFVFSSLMEGLGTAVLEAMAADIPVVSFDIPPVREVTDHGRVAYLVPVGDADQLAETIRKVLVGDLPNTAEAARTHVTDNYDIQAVARSLNSLLVSAAESQP